MRRLVTLAIAGLCAFALSGCIVVPPRHGYYQHHDHGDRYDHGGYRGR